MKSVLDSQTTMVRPCSEGEGKVEMLQPEKLL